MSLYDLLKKTVELFDSHAHLHFEGYDADLNGVIQRAKDAGLSQIFGMSIDIKSCDKNIKIGKLYPDFVKIFVGIDPECFIPGSDLFSNEKADNNWFSEKCDLLSKIITQNPKLITGIGETGMDFYWLEQNKDLIFEEKEKSKKLQENLFRMHLELAKKFNLPLSIHARGAEEMCLQILKEYNVYGIFHSYTASYDVAKKIIESGCGIGINGIVTFPKADNIRELVKKIMGENLLNVTPADFYKKGIYFETDAPFLAPQNFRGQRNEPSYLKEIYEKVLQIIA